MHYTITFNPAIDLVMNFNEEIKVGDLNRAASEEYVIGGKGINVSSILHTFSLDNVATGFVGGFTGDHIKKSLESRGIKTYFVQAEGVSRINVKIKGTDETEINAKGPHVVAEQFQTLLDYFETNLTADDTIYLCGNTVPGLGVEAYQAIAQLALDKNARFVLDTNTAYLTECLRYKPFLIKPNQAELEEIFQVTIQSEAELIQYARTMQEQGARNVLVSRGGDGALLLTEDGDVYESNTPKGTVLNSVGAGDSMVAGFMAEYSKSQDYERALQYGAASGSATAFSVGIAERDQIEALVSEITITKR